MSQLKPNISAVEPYKNFDIMDYETNSNVVSFCNSLVGIICAFGIILNILNIVVFVKQGLNTSTNIALTSLTIVDICNLLLSCIGLLLISPLTQAAAENTFVPLEMALISAFPHLIFVPIKSWINVFMTTERCLCIALPLKIKQIINPRRTVISMIAIYLLISSTAIPEYSEIYVDWKFYPNVNKTLLGLNYRHTRDFIEAPVYFTLSIILLTSFPVVILLTSVLIYKLLMVSKWRKKSVMKKDGADSGDLRDRNVIRLVVVIASFLIISLAPSVLLSALSYSLSDFNLFGKYTQAFVLLGNISYIFDAVNSSFNIFIYYNMSSNFKRTFQQIFFPGSK